MSGFRRFVLSLVVVLALTNSVNAQSYRLSGRVNNTSGEAIPNAKILIIKGSETGDTLKTSSDAGGNYSLIVGGDMVLNPVNNNQVLFNNYPNPFSGYTLIPYKIEIPGWVQVSIHDLGGRLIKDLVDMEQEAGEYSVSWDGTNMQGTKQAMGVYLVVLTTSGFPEAIHIFYDPEGIYANPQMSESAFKSLNNQDESLLIPKIIVSAQNYETKVISNFYLEEGDNTLNITLSQLANILFKVDDHFFYVLKNGAFEKITIYGINIGVGTPGKTPGQVNSISYEEYIEWFNLFLDVGFNTIRIYTLHGPQCYRAL